jgi:hypothetical protein
MYMSLDFERALRAGDVPRVTAILTEKCWSIDTIDSQGATVLMLAVLEHSPRPR